MIKTELFRLGIINLWHSKLRTMLTILGVAIGIGALISMVSFGVGMQKNVTHVFKENELLTTLHCTGSNINAIPGSASGNENIALNDSVLKEIQKIKGVLIAYPFQSFPVLLKYETIEFQANIQVLPSELAKYKPYNNITYGNFLSSETAKEIILNAMALKGLKIKLCKEADCKLSTTDSLNGFKLMKPDHLINSNIQITTASLNMPMTKGNIIKSIFSGPESFYKTTVSEFKIEGIIQNNDFGNALINGSGAIPTLTAQKIPKMGFSKVSDLLGSKPGDYSLVYVRTHSVDDIEKVKNKIEKMGIHVVSLYEQLDEIKTQFLILDAILGVIGSIALFVAAIGIVNTMVMSVMERTKEIGIMRSVGARKLDIRTLFLIEAGTIGLIGSGMGIFLGWVITKLAGFIFNSYILKDQNQVIDLFYFPFWLILGAIIFAMFVGILAGLYPASRAARVNPVNALHYE